MIFNIIKKELRELVTKATILSMVMLALIFFFVGQVIGGATEEASRPPVIAVVDLDSSAISAAMTGSLELNAEIAYSGTDKTEAQERLKEKEGSAVIVIPGGFGNSLLSGEQGHIEIEWYVEGAGITESIPGSVVEYLVAHAREQVSAAMITGNSSLDPALVLDPVSVTNVTYFRGQTLTGLTPSELNNIVSSQSMAIPIAIMMLVIMAGTSLISSMGMEKENKTLETLLTMPIKRSYIITGKIVASAVVSLIMAIVYMVGFSYYLNSFTAGSVDPAQYGLTLGVVEYALIGLSVFLALLAALAISLVLGSFSTNYRSAQSLTFPLIGLAMFSMFMNMFQDFATMGLPLQVIVFIIPFSHPMMAMKELMFGNYGIVLAGIGYSFIFTVAAISLAVWIFNTDRLLTGRINRRIKLVNQS